MQTVAVFFVLIAMSLPEKVCTVVRRPWVRSAEISYLVGVGTPDSVTAAQWQPFRFTDKLERVDTGAVVPVYGQVVTIAMAGGQLRETRAEKAVIVFWSSGSMCERLPPTRSAPIPEGSAVFIEGSLRPEPEWIAGQPVIDVYLAKHLHFPHESNEDRGRFSRLMRGRTLTAREYFKFYERLPIGPDDGLDTALVRAGNELLRWSEQNRLISSRQPAQSILESARAELRTIPNAGTSILPALRPSAIAAGYGGWWPKGENLMAVHGPVLRAEYGRVQLSFDRLRGSQKTTGVPCGGFILDGEFCRRQQIFEELTVWRGAVAYIARTSSSPWRGEFAFSAGVTYLQNYIFGRETGAFVRGEGGALEVGFSPSVVRELTRSPFSITATMFSAGFLVPAQECKDCYTPFSDFVAVGFSVGARYTF